MEDAMRPRNSSDQGREQGAESGVPPEPALVDQEQSDRNSTKKSYKRFLLINAGVIGLILLIGIVFTLFIVPPVPKKSLSEENARLKAEIKRLKRDSPGPGERSKEQLRIENLIGTLQPRLGPSVVEPIARAVVKYAQSFDLPPELILSIINTTSRFEITAEGEYGSVGLMHISPKVYRNELQELGITDQEAYHIDNNIHLGCMVLRSLRDQGRSMEVAIATLIGGERKVDEILVGFTNSIIAHKKMRNQVPIQQSGPAEGPLSSLDPAR